jgi:hypothetical protein
MKEITVFGNVTPDQGTGWFGDVWHMWTTDEFSPGDRRTICRRRNSKVWMIPRSQIVSGPKQEGICTNGFGPNYSVTFRYNALEDHTVDFEEFSGEVNDTPLGESV